MTTSSSSSNHQHGVKGVYYGGDWLDLEDCHKAPYALSSQDCSGCDFQEACPRSRSRKTAEKGFVRATTAAPNAGNTSTSTTTLVPQYDICIVGAGCIGSAIARQLSRYQGLSIVLVEAADDVSQGATKGNSGIVHAGYDDKPGSVRAQHCWPGNQMFAKLDEELRFGYQKNGSLVIATKKEGERAELKKLLERGRTNGVERLRIVEAEELRQMEPHVHPDAVAALYAPDAGNVIPYEFAIALAENAVDNGVELRIRSKVASIEMIKEADKDEHDMNFTIQLEHWEPSSYIALAGTAGTSSDAFQNACRVMAVIVFAHYVALRLDVLPSTIDSTYHMVAMVVLAGLIKFSKNDDSINGAVSRSTPLADLVQQASAPVGGGNNSPDMSKDVVSVGEMLQGGSGSATAMHGKHTRTSSLQARYIINCAGGAADQVARLIGDDSFTIKPRLGDYLLLHKNQGHLAKHTLFPCPDPVLGKGVLVQTTLWSNLILGPTARDTYKPEARDMSKAAVQEYILSKCKALVPSFDPKETIHAFCGARAKSDRGDWIIEPSKQHASFIHVAGIDSPGLAGSPSIALTVSKMLEKSGLKLTEDPNFKPNRAAIIVPKDGMKGLKMGPVGKFDSDGTNTEQMAKNVICKCEKVTELEVVQAMRRSLPIDSSQAIRKRTRAGMGHCQGDAVNYNCEGRVRAIIARENGVPVEQIGGRPWPATSTLPRRWLSDEDKDQLQARAQCA